MSYFTISKPIGILSDDEEYLLDDDGQLMIFPTKWIAECYLIKHGISEPDLQYFNFNEEEEDDEEIQCG